MEVKIARFELYPEDDPTGYAVGFHITLKNGRSFYVDTIVSLENAQGKSDNEIAALAWATLEEIIDANVKRLNRKSSLIGNKWRPPKNKK